MASSCCAAIACCIGHPSCSRLKLETLPLTQPKTVILKICKQEVLAFLQLVFLFAQLPCSTTQTLQYGNSSLTNGKNTSSIYESILVRLLDHSYAHAMHLLDFTNFRPILTFSGHLRSSCPPAYGCLPSILPTKSAGKSLQSLILQNSKAQQVRSICLRNQVSGAQQTRR